MKNQIVILITAVLFAVISQAQAPVPSPTPTAGKALVCVYHMRETFGGWWLHDVAHPDVFMDGSLIETVYGPGYFVIELTPGKHVLNASKHIKSVVNTTFDETLNVEAGKSYFVKITNHFSGVSAHHAWTLGLVSTEQAQQEMAGLKQTFAAPNNGK